MDVLWDRGTADGSPADGLTVREVTEALRERDLAYTTGMTVLERLTGTGMAVRERDGRAWRYQPAAGREAYIAQLMLDALDLAHDGTTTGGRGAALIRFARSVSGEEARLLRRALDEQARGRGEGE